MNTYHIYQIILVSIVIKQLIFFITKTETSQLKREGNFDSDYSDSSLQQIYATDT